MLLILLSFVLPGALRVKEDYTLTEEQGQKISSKAEIQNRIKTIRELAEVARSHHLEDVCNIVFLLLDINIFNLLLYKYKLF